MEWTVAIERLHHTLQTMTQYTQEQHDLYHHCQHRVITVAQHTLQAAWQWEEPTIGDQETAVVRREGQGAIARLTELNLLLLHSLTKHQDDGKTAEEIIEGYAAYQKQVLRLRVRPAIATLVEARKDGTIHASSVEENVQVHDDDDDEHDDEVETKKPPTRIQQHHAPVLMEILGEASALIHPLLQWHFSLPSVEDEPAIVTQIRTLCHTAITVLDEQTQQLVQRISDWFGQDRPMEEWMNQDDKEVDLQELSRLDALVDEMAFICQLLARYEQLMMPLEATAKRILQNELLPEWNWKYAALERIWAVRQWQSALQHATPVTIVLGTEVNVPSVVEDAQYLSTRALERAASTRSLSAIGTVAHAVTHDVWSLEMVSGVHQALLEQRGCWSSPKKKKEEDDNEADKISMEKSPNSGFASALLEALDDDIAKAGPPTPKAPSSGSFLSSIVSSLDENVQLMQLDMEFCVLNGLLAASVSCRNLVAFLDSLLSEDEFSFLSASEKTKSTTMIHLAREELFRFEQGYRATLKTKIAESIVSWCGSGKHEDACPPNFRGKALNHLRYFLEHENYQLDPVSFAQSESDDRLERDFLGPLKESIFLKSMGNKCDADVLPLLAEQLSTSLVELLSESIWECESMFTDCGSLLLSKQFRMIQSFVANVTQPSGEGAVSPNLFHVWEPLSQIVFALQLEKPADWQAYQSTSVLSPESLFRTMKKRLDFSPEAVQSVVAQFRRAKEGSK